MGIEKCYYFATYVKNRCKTNEPLRRTPCNFTNLRHTCFPHCRAEKIAKWLRPSRIDFLKKLSSRGSRCAFKYTGVELKRLQFA